MANRRYSESNPNHKEEKEMGKGPGMKNDDGRELGEKYNKVGKSSTKFNKVVYPNESVPSLGDIGGVAEK